MSKEKWYCTLPWTGFSNDPDGKVRPCCLYKDYIKDDNGEYMHVQTHSIDKIFNSGHMKSLREDFRQGNKPKACSTCIIDEANGHKSKREIYTRNSNGTHQPIINFESEPDHPIEFQLIISNACNLKCRSCSPSHSNLWQAEHKVIWGNTGYPMVHGQSGDKNGRLWTHRNEWLDTIERLEIVGGEPFYIQQWTTIWDELIESGRSKEIHMSMSSNCVIFAGERIKYLNDNFKHIGLGLSIDGMGTMYDYLRHPGKWDEVKENLLAYNKMQSDGLLDNVGVSISHTIGWLNAFYIPEFTDWVNANLNNFQNSNLKTAIWYNLIHSPDHMALWAIPDSVKDQIEYKLRNSTVDQEVVNGLVNHMNSRLPNNNELRALYSQFRVNDKLRGENILDVIPPEFLDAMRGLFNE